VLSVSIWPRPLVALSRCALSKPPVSTPGLSGGSQLSRPPCLRYNIIVVHGFANSACTAGPTHIIFNLRRSDHITDALVSLHWLRVSEWIDYKIAVLTYKVLHGGTPRYLGPLTSVAGLCGRSAVTNRLVVPSVRLSTVGSRALPVAAPRIWNSLPQHVVTAATPQSFKKHLKTFLLQRWYSLAL